VSILHKDSLRITGLTLCWVGLVFICATVNVARFVGLERSPPGFHVDELGGAVTIQCLVTEGRDAKGYARLPLLFSDLKFGTPKPPTYIYPAIVWTKFFGFSIASFRGFIAFVVVLTIIGLFFLSQMLMGRAYAMIVVLIASISPWAWMFSRISYEPMLGPCFMVWGVYFFLKSKKIWSCLLAGICFSAAMYSYPPMRLQVPLLMISLIIFALFRKEIKLSYILGLLAATGLSIIPLVYYVVTMDLQSRFGYVGIISEDYLASVGKTNSFLDLLFIFIQNFFLHFKPSFLFFKGSLNAMHSSGYVGILSWTESCAVVLGCLCLVWRLVRTKCKSIFRDEQHQYIVLFFINILIGVIPSALTWEGLPHALRTIIAWPFVCLVLSYVLWRIIERWKFALPVICIISALFVIKFGEHYFTDYPKYTYGMYSPWSKEEAQAAKTDMDWLRFIVRHRHQDYHTCYYLMNYRGDSCSEARAKWDQIHKVVK